MDTTLQANQWDVMGPTQIAEKMRKQHSLFFSPLFLDISTYPCLDSSIAHWFTS
jgi:hypothetical protein